MSTPPKAFLDHNHLREGPQVERHNRPRYKLDDLLAQMPEGLPRVEGWEDMRATGQECATYQGGADRT